LLNPDLDPEEQNKPTKTEISCFEVLNVLFRELKAFPVAWATLMKAWDKEI
jgi:hypothetical protein